MINLPLVSIVTPSYNQVDFIEATIQSILSQDYPNIEYIIIDGGSNDGSVEIIRKYASHLAYWVSEPDGGQSDAINLGFKHSTGEILAWLNSDDLYFPGTLNLVAQAYIETPNAIIAGDVENFGVDGKILRNVKHRNISLSNVIKFWNGRTWHQPGLFFPRAAYMQVGQLDIRLQYAMDYDLLCRLLQFAAVSYLERNVTRFRIHPDSKTSTQAGYGFLLENTEVSQRYWHLLPSDERVGCEHDLTRLLVRRAGRMLFNRKPMNAIHLLLTSLRISKVETILNLNRQIFNVSHA
jgi:glycosyltransferase involved in cell wall biosynthesis